MTSPPEPFPLLIGITGKRRFSDDSAEEAVIRARVRKRLAQAFAYIGKRCPHVPKVLLTGGAFGSDLLAAEAALAAGTDWSVAIVLPYDEDLFEYDFFPDEKRPDVEHPDLRILRALLAEAESGAGRRVLARAMPRLMSAAGVEASRDELNKHSDLHDRALRRAHYEQAGQYIAETAMVLVAVMDPDERPDIHMANGATPRIVAARRAGRPDAAGTAVSARSAVVRREWSELLASPGGYVWLLDPSDMAARAMPPVRVLPPLRDRPVADVFGGYPGREMPSGRNHHSMLMHLALRAHDRSARLLGWPAMADRLRLRDSVHPMLSFDDFEQLRRQDPKVPPNPISLDAVTDTAQYIDRLRDMIRRPQRHAREKVDRGRLWVSGLFVFAIAALETSAKFFHRSWMPMLAYVAATVTIGIVVFHTRLNLWEPRSEDYRAISEMLRVQRAWWGAGLTDRVDRVHLQGVDVELARPRDAARAILGWLALLTNWTTATGPAANWSQVRAVPAGEPADRPRSTNVIVRMPRAPADWIGQQLSFYAKTVTQREEVMHRRDTETWLLFTTAAILAAVVAMWLLVPDSMDWFAGPLPILAWTILAAVAVGLRMHLRKLRGWPGIVMMLLTGVVCAAGLGVTLVGLGHGAYSLVREYWACGPLREIESASEMTKRMTVWTFVVLTAIAGAVRFHAEKSGYEAEAFAYRDALDKFERAERAIAALTDPVSGVPGGAGEMEARALVRELGYLALHENETWLKTHRERPLSPVVG